MAHENLRFRLNVEDREDYQPVLASQDYGTFYLVYAKITSYEKIAVNGMEKHKYLFDFKLQNFRGSITMGFVDDNEDDHKTFSLGKSNTKNRILFGDYELVVKVAPFKISSEITQIPFVLDEPLKSGDIIRTNLGRQKPPKELYLSDNPDQSKYLNPYRFSRDGDDYLELSSRIYGSGDPFREPDSGGVHGGFCIPELTQVV